jgi:glucose/arabinose dehydrogenase
VGTGDAGHPALTDDPHSLAGKILRVSDIGKPAQGNPTRGSRVFASGLTHTDGLCATTDSTLAFQTESVPSAPSDPIFQVLPGKTFGVDAGADQPIGSQPKRGRGPGGCAIMNSMMFTTSLDGEELLAAQISTTPSGLVKLGAWSTTLHDRYGRLRTVVAATDGALWLTTSNKDGKGKPVPADERVLRIVPTGGDGNNPL